MLTGLVELEFQLLVWVFIFYHFVCVCVCVCVRACVRAYARVHEVLARQYNILISPPFYHVTGVQTKYYLDYNCYI